MVENPVEIDHTMYDHVYLSPHFDDAALSCGGLIHQQTQAGQAVLVVTVYAAPPEPGRALSSFARQFNEAMGNPVDLNGARRREDRAAIARLGAELVWLDFQDAIYRAAEAEAWYYTSIADVFGSIHPGDLTLPDAIAEAVGEQVSGSAQATVYAPLTVGHHVDHQLVHRAAWMLRAQGRKVLFYEDYPYADPAYRLPFNQPNPAPLAATLAALKDARLTPDIRRLSEPDLHAWIDSVRAYRSQVPLLFGDEAAMARRLRAFALHLDGETPAERLWIPG